MFRSAFDKINPDTYCHDYYEDYNELTGITKEQHTENMRIKLLITEELVEELKNYESIYFGYYFNSSIDMLPSNIKKITWSTFSLFATQINKFPENLETLDLTKICPDVNICKIPDNVKVLELPSKKINLINIPLNIETLYLGGQTDSLELSSQLNKLELIKKLSVGITNEDTYTDFDLTNLPPKLEILEINSINNINLSNLPNRLRELVIESDFDGSSLDFLPESLEQLVIKSSQNSNINLDFLPTNLKTLIFFARKNSLPMNMLPINLEDLDIMVNSLGDTLILPPNLKKLKITTTDIISNIIFPPTLIDLTIDGKNLTNLVVLPENLLSLKIYNYTPNAPLPLKLSFRLPVQLKYLNISYNIDLEFINLPVNLEILILNCEYNYVLPELPESLKTLYLKRYSKQITKFNKGLSHLYVNQMDTNIKIPPLPENLSSLYIESDIDTNFNIPPNLTYFGFNPKKLININSNQQKFIEKILNKMPDSIEIFTTDLDISKYIFNRLPRNLMEIGIENRHLVNSEFKFVEHFQTGGCDNNFNDILLYLVEDYSDIRNFNKRVCAYFDTYK
jgi:hypothetical protein